MKIYNNIEDFSGVDCPVATIGTFDGVHIGHQKIINVLRETARKCGGETIIITFDPHPRRILYPDSRDLKMINSIKRKIDLFRKMEVDHLIIIPFNREFASLSSYDFIKKILVDKIGVKKIVVGYDHHFGNKRLGNYKSLEEFGNDNGFEVEQVPAQYVDGVAVSSSKIRKALKNGEIALANKYLGYEYSIYGKVIEGFKVGRKIGFPTANIEVEDSLKLITANGVYACRICWKKKKFLGMGNIGERPTLNRKDHTIEVHIFGFNEEIYGDFITIYWIDRIRDEIKFRNLQELKKQLEKDKKFVLENYR